AVTVPSVDSEEDTQWELFAKFVKSLKGPSRHTHVWPELKIGWTIIVGSIIAFFGAAFGSAGGVGAGGIFVPMLTLVIGFDAKSSAAISKCMIMGLSAATACFNLRQRHPTFQRPIIDYDLALIVQPMLLLGISIGVTLNVIFANWMVTVLLIIAFLGTSTRSFFKGVEMWKKETIKKESAQHVKSGGGEGSGGEINRPLLGGPNSGLPVAVGVTLYQAIKLIRRRIVEDNTTEESEAWSVRTQQLIFCALVSLLAGTLGGLLGLGGGFLLAPMFLEMGIIPQVSSVTATFVMTFSASICAIEYYLLDRFPVPYAAYLTVIAIVASIVGQHVVKKWIAKAERASLIVFIFSTIIFASAILLGGEGIVDMIHKIRHNEYMGFEDLCSSGGDGELTRGLGF
ncbi:hypothetical protein KSS87_018286, partial [Heliosperma pusillum]